MKKIFFYLMLISLSVVNCKKETSKKQKSTTEDIQQFNYINGTFLMTKDAAVIQSPSEMYAVKIDEKAKKLANQCKQYQDSKYDMVPVSVKGIVIKNPNEGWERMVIIKEIIKVEPIKVKEEIIELKTK